MDSFIFLAIEWKEREEGTAVPNQRQGQNQQQNQ